MEMSKGMREPFFEAVGIGMQSHLILFKPCLCFPAPLKPDPLLRLIQRAKAIL